MMMKVSLSEHAKQPLSLPLPPKVFFHLSFTSFTLCSWLSSWSCEHCVSCTLPIITTISFFLNPAPLSFCFSLFGSNPSSLDPPLHGIVIVLWSYNLSWSMWWCAVQTVVNTSFGVHSFGFYSLFLWQCGLPHSFTAIGSEPNQGNGIQMKFSYTKKLEDKSWDALFSNWI